MVMAVISACLLRVMVVEIRIMVCLYFGKLIELTIFVIKCGKVETKIISAQHISRVIG